MIAVLGEFGLYVEILFLRLMLNNDYSIFQLSVGILFYYLLPITVLDRAGINSDSAIDVDVFTDVDFFVDIVVFIDVDVLVNVEVVVFVDVDVVVFVVVDVDVVFDVVIVTTSTTKYLIN